MRLNFFTLFILLLAFTACGTVHPVRTIGKGNTDVHLSLGGPVANVAGLALPIPYLMLGMDRGIAEKLDISANVHITPAIFGILGIDAGATYMALEQKGFFPTVNTNARLVYFSDMKSILTLSEISAIASYKLGEDHLLFFGPTALLQPKPFKILPAVSLGAEQKLAKRWSFSLECRWIAPELYTKMLAVQWYGPKWFGAIGIYFGLNWYAFTEDAVKNRRQD